MTYSAKSDDWGPCELSDKTIQKFIEEIQHEMWQKERIAREEKTHD